jgi:tryptophan-rich sensory protein
MGAAASRVAEAGGRIASLPVVAWFAHYLLNLSWPFVFFGARRLRAGLWLNCLLTASTAWIAPTFHGVDATAGLLLVPYASWLLFATALNWAICRRNPTVKGYNEAMLQHDICRLQREAAEYAGV